MADREKLDIRKVSEYPENLTLVILVRGGTLGHQKAITLPPQRIRGRRSQDGSEVKKFKTIICIIKWIHFSKISIFSRPTIPFLYENFQKIEQISKNFLIISKNNFTVSIFMVYPLNAEKFPLNSIS